MCGAAPAHGRDRENVAAGGPFIAHDAADERDLVSIGRPSRVRDLKIGLVDLTDFPGRGGDGKQLRGPPVVIAVAFGRGVCQPVAVGRPIVLVYVGIGRRDWLGCPGCETPEERGLTSAEALLIDVFLDHSRVFRGWFEGPHARGAFSVNKTAIFTPSGDQRGVLEETRQIRKLAAPDSPGLLRG